MDLIGPTCSISPREGRKKKKEGRAGTFRTVIIQGLAVGEPSLPRPAC